MLLIVVVFCVVATHKMLPAQSNPYAVPTIDVAVQAQTANITANESVSSSQFPRTKHENQASICINNRTREHYVGELVSREEVVHHASKYWSGRDVEIMAAITIAEGQRDLNCIGDEVEWFQGRRLYGAKTADGRTWGASYGLFQVRTIQEDNNPGSCRNKNTILASIEEQFRCAKEIWDSQGYGAWSQYSNGSYRKHLGK